ncbi:hypothetical protein G8D25_01120 (plasmid) [Ralstonia solanacearum]|uniref:efflux RND transporter permease subunit n=1 Tax=Ralstonia solanacearum TaxID=305 RepID=UPI001449E387|nr:efflux RND transporter permease subunit [Ralstonia solanacearum]QJC22940.1 hypothetical protein G8D25_01120 [Ralstonia solanacearum]
MLNWRRRARIVSGVARRSAGRQYQVDIDREGRTALGVAFADINAVLSTAMGSAYVNDFPNAGRMQQG